ncbi:MAG: hypothetical protein AAF680_00790 [Pseudomonadota bacterium]
MSAGYSLDYQKLRNMAAIIATLSGLLQCASLWLLPTTPVLLLTAFTGAVYVVLGLGLFGISRFSLLLAITAPPVRSWLGLFPLEITTWEWLRTAADISIALLCLPVFWASLSPDFESIEPGSRSMSADDTDA